MRLSTMSDYDDDDYYDDDGDYDVDDDYNDCDDYGNDFDDNDHNDFVESGDGNDDVDDVDVVYAFGCSIDDDDGPSDDIDTYNEFVVSSEVEVHATANDNSDDDDNNEPTIIKGWEHSTCAHPTTDYAAQRYSYIGKDENTGEPMWLDYGPKSNGARSLGGSSGIRTDTSKEQYGRGTSTDASSGTNAPTTSSTPPVVQGWDVASHARQPSNYAAERYAYIGKDEDTREPMFLDYGAKGTRNRECTSGRSSHSYSGTNSNEGGQPRTSRIGVVTTTTTVSSSHTNSQRTAHHGSVNTVTSSSIRSTVSASSENQPMAARHMGSITTVQPRRTTRHGEVASASTSSSTCQPRTARLGTVKTVSPSAASTKEPTILKGWEYSTYANANTEYAARRYAYIGKDETTREPMWLDYGPNGNRK